MNPTFSGTLFDGEILATRPVTVGLDRGRLQVSADGEAFDLALAEIPISDRLGSTPRYLYLPGNRTIETPDNAAIDALLAGHNRGKVVALVHWLEERSRAATLATLVIVSVVGATLWWALPILARRGAMAVPPEIETKAGEVARKSFEKILAPTQLAFKDRARVEHEAKRLARAAGLAWPPQIIFRSMGGKSPNAFALPGGSIIVSDELVNMATDDEIAAVLAHEFGHWQLRHGVQSLLRNSAALLVVSTITGDLSSLTTFAGTVPFLLLQRGYDRTFEEEADAYGIELLRKAGIDVKNFASILNKLEAARPKEGADFSYLSTHPTTEDRIRRIGAASPPAAKPPAAALMVDAADLVARPGQKLTVARETGYAPPRFVVQPMPRFPADQAKDKIEGEVLVEFFIDVNGDVHSPHAVRSTRKEFEPTALAAVSRWKAVPAMRADRVVATVASQLFHFHLPGGNPDAESSATVDAPSFRLPEPSEFPPPQPIPAWPKRH